MKKSHHVFVAALVCAGVLQISPAEAQLKTQTVDNKHADAALEGYRAYDATGTSKRLVFSCCIATVTDREMVSSYAGPPHLSLSA